MVRYRKSVMPRQMSDLGAFIFVTCMIPLTYIWEVYFITPELYKGEVGRWYVHMTLGFIIVTNIVGNFVGLWLVDTSTRHIVIPSGQIGDKWHFCASCEAVSPPRAWHCSSCNTCILKREHHCMFAGYCVGHFNHRYFILFLVWLWFGVVYCTYFNSLYVWTLEDAFSVFAILKFIFPLIMIMSGMDMSYSQVAIFFWSVHVAALLLVTVLLIYHVRLICIGATTFESNRRIKYYNLGLKQNWLEVLGHSWALAIIWPFGDSKLPHNGVSWDTQETWKLEAPKNR